jgi:hypothetical protein
VNEWIEKAGLPKNAPQPQSDAFAKVETQANDYSSGKIAATAVQSKKLDDAGMASFSENNAGRTRRAANGGTRQAFNLTKVGNSEIAFQWLLMSIKNDTRRLIRASKIS